jgi:energy-coupling factor transporter ATP-binding protein EcfA2
MYIEYTNHDIDKKHIFVHKTQKFVKYYKKQAKTVNDHITLQIYRGEIFGILGDNGAGKSTLIRQMVNLLRSTSGFIRLLGRDMPYKRELKSTGCSVATDDRKGRDGVNQSSTLRRLNIPRTPKCRCVDEGLVPSRPLRSFFPPHPLHS